jgi:hypothetical protein
LASADLIFDDLQQIYHDQQQIARVTWTRLKREVFIEESGRAREFCARNLKTPGTPGRGLKIRLSGGAIPSC